MSNKSHDIVSADLDGIKPYDLFRSTYLADTTLDLS